MTKQGIISLFDAIVFTYYNMSKYWGNDYITYSEEFREAQYNKYCNCIQCIREVTTTGRMYAVDYLLKLERIHKEVNKHA